MKILSRLAIAMRQLQWKLTWSYTLTTLLVLVMVKSVFVVFLSYLLINTQSSLANTASNDADTASPFFITSFLDKRGLERWLDTNFTTEQSSIDIYSGYRTVIDTQGKIIVIRGTSTIHPGMSLYS